MKKLLTLSFLLLMGLYTFAQTQVLRPAGATSTITQEEVNAMGQQANANRSVIVLNFEGIADNQPVGNYYNGGGGPNYGIYFNPETLALIDADAGGGGNFANEPSPSTIMFFLTGSPIMNVAAGFSTGLSFYYCSITATGTVQVWDNLNGTGNLLATQSLPPLGSAGNGDPTGAFDIFGIAAVPFSGVAKSVTFSGVQNQIGFDDITFGSLTPGYETPVSNWALFIGIGLILVFAIVRFRRVV
jgi:hypothetical protein